MSNLYHLLQRVPAGMRLANTISRAVNGDPEAAEELRRNGVGLAIDFMVGPGYGDVSRRILHQTNDFLAGVNDTLNGNVIDGEFVELPPWYDFTKWIKRQTWGSYVILGPKGQGKTTLALRLAQLWHEKTHYPVEVVMTYPEDRYNFVKPVPTQRFINRIKAIIGLLNSSDKEEEEEETDTLDSNEINHQLAKYKHRIVVIDEMSLTVGTSGTDAGRAMVRQIMAQARHLQWLLIYVGQLAKMLPNDLLNCEAIFVKKPNGREILTDRDDRLTRELWQDAEETFSRIRKNAWWKEYPDIRAWAHVDCRDMGNGRSYKGPVPFSLPSSADNIEVVSVEAQEEA